MSRKSCSSTASRKVIYLGSSRCGRNCGLPEQLYDIDWRKQIGDTAVTFCALSGAADP